MRSGPGHGSFGWGRDANGPEPRREGFSLVEVIVALALFALIGVAGYSMLSGVLQTQERTGGRLDRLAEIQRALFVIATDLDQAASQPQGNNAYVVLRKTSASGQSVLIRYELEGDGIVRTVSGGIGERSQRVLSGVGSLGFSYFRKGEGWTEDARVIAGPDPEPSQSSPTGPQMTSARPAVSAGPVSGSSQTMLLQQAPVSAIAIDLSLAGVDGRQTTVRRVVTIPEVRP